MRYLFTLVVLSLFGSTYAQFRFVGSASSVGNNCIELTDNVLFQIGAAWNTTPVDLNNPFELYASVYLGASNSGGDGITFTMQNDIDADSALGSFGNFLGYGGLQPSIAIEFDVFQLGGTSDPVFDHTAIHQNGSVDHASPNNLAGPVQLDPANPDVEDNAFHDVHIIWDPFTQTLSMWWDCQLRITYTGNVVDSIFSGNSTVYWGFTGSTGGVSNLQQVCVHEAHSDTVSRILCQGDTITMDAGPGQTYSWMPFFNLSDASVRSPQFWPDTTTTYTVQVLDSCGDSHTWTYTVQVDDPNAIVLDLGPDFNICGAGSDSVLDMFRPGVSYLWQDGSTDSAFTVTSPGLYWLEVANFCGVNRDSINIGLLPIPAIDLGADDTLCVGDTVRLNVATEGATYIWQDGTTDSQYVVTRTGLYFVTVTNDCGVDMDSVYLEFQDVPVVDLGVDTTICDSSNLLLDATFPAATYVWQDGVGTPTYTVTQTGLYFVQVTTVCGTSADSIAVAYSSPPMVDLGPDQSVCEGTIVRLDATTVPDATYIWQDGTMSPIYEAIFDGLYEVTVVNNCGIDQDSFFLEVQTPITATTLPDTAQVCINDSITLNTGQGRFAHLWSDLSTDSFLVVSEPGMYGVAITNACGTFEDTTEIIQVTPPEVDLGLDQEVCEGETITLSASWPYSDILWENNTTNPIRDITQTGVYSVILSNICGTGGDDVSLTFNPRPGAVSLGNNRDICEGDSIFFDVEQPNLIPQPLYRWQDGRTGPTYTARFGGFYQVVVRNECGESVANVTLNETPLPQVEISGDSVFCEDETAILEAFSATNTATSWPDGSVGSGYIVQDQGLVVVRAENSCGLAEDSLFVRAANCFCRITVPTAFTPNGDGFNEAFRIVSACNIEQGIWRVVDRWGRTVFSSDNPDSQWFGLLPNGKNAPDGVYIWTYQFTTRGEGAELVVREETGTVTLFR